MSPNLYSFNRGMISPAGLGRIDLKRTSLSAETMTNWMPRTLGSMTFRPGMEYLGSTKDNAAARFIPFVFSEDDQALIELTNAAMRIWVDDAVVTRGSVTSAVTNGTFTTDVTSWTDSDEALCTSEWVTGGYLGLTGTDSAYAIRDQEITVTDTGEQHALAVVVAKGVIRLKVGSSAGASDYIDSTLIKGVHSLAFTPTGNFHIRIMCKTSYQTLVDSIAVESSGALELAAPWLTADLTGLQYDQSGDVVFVAADGHRQRRIERRGTTSWSIVDYLANDGPFRIENTSETTLTASATEGDITIAASDDVFESGHVGALFSISSEGQHTTEAANAEDMWTDPIRVIGVDSGRRFSFIREGTWVATVTLQRSVNDPGDWSDVATYADAGTDDEYTTTYNDNLDNQVIWYRLGVKTGNYTSGTVNLQMIHTAGSITGFARIDSVTDSQNVNAHVLTALGGTDATETWAEGEWSDERGWPSGVALHEGRLWWAGKDKVQGSMSDAYDSFGDADGGDSGYVSRSIGSGPVDTISWLQSNRTLLMGAFGSIYAVRSSSLEEPITPTNFNLKPISSVGSADVEAQKIDGSTMFTQRSGRRVHELSYDSGLFDYVVRDSTAIVPEIGASGVVRTAVQRQPDTRSHWVRSDGKVALFVSDKLEDVKCWCLIETDGTIEDVVVLPCDDEEDSVYYVVNRTIGGSTKRYLEKCAYLSEAEGATINKMADCFYEYSGASTTTISSLSHLEGETVTAWGNGKDLGSYTVSSGSITLTEAVTYAVVGLSYSGTWKSVKLAFATQEGESSFKYKKRIEELGLILRNTHAQGLEYGPDFTTMDNLPPTENYAAVDSDSVWGDLDEDTFIFPGGYETDARLCMRATAPRPATVLAAIINMKQYA